MKQFSTRAEIVTARTYCRPTNEEATSFETWSDVCYRVLEHQKWLWQRAVGRDLNAAEIAELHALGKLMADRSALPAGRTLWLGGTDLVKRREAANFNCSYLKVETVHDIVDAFWLLLQGCGVGFTPVPGTLNGFMRPIPHVEVIRSNRKTKGGRQGNRETWDPATKTWTISVGDSGEAWAKSIGKLLAGKFPAERLVLEFSEVRPAGTRLSGYGWICSGDSVIAVEYPKIAAILNKRAGRLLTHIDILDILNHLGVIQTGRRGAEIAIYGHQDSGWRDFATAKTDYWTTGNNQRAQSNNSLIFYRKPSLLDLHDLFDLMLKSGGSEPGILNGEAAERRAPWVSGVNPCVTGDTPILTTTGYVPIQQVVDQEVKVWNGEEWSKVKPFSTGLNDTVIVHLSDGASLRCTPYHKFLVWDGWTQRGTESRVCAEDLRPGDKLSKYEMPTVRHGRHYLMDAYSQGFYSGDGCTGLNHSWLYEPKYACQSRLIGSCSIANGNRKTWKHGPMFDKVWVPVDGHEDYCLNWLAGLLDSDGTVTSDDNGQGFQICSINETFLLNIRLMLSRLGVRAKVVKCAPAGMRLLPDGRGGSAEYFCQKTYRLLIGNTDAYYLTKRGLKLSRLVHTGNPPQRDARRFVRVVSVEEAEPAETFCFTEPLANRGTFNGIVTGQCAEILLANKGFCNLVSTDIGAFQDDYSLHRAIRLISRANYRQCLVDLDDGILQRAWHENNQFLRLCGSSLAGIVRRPDLLNPYDLKVLRQSAWQGAVSMADELGTERPKNVTTIKPEGTRAKIADTTEGAHFPRGRYIFNNITFSRHDPLVALLDQAGYRVFDNPLQPDGVVATFPVEWRDISFPGGSDKSVESALDQLSRYKLLMDNYVDQNASITVSYRPDEIPNIVRWLQDNWDSYVGVSFLLAQDPTKTAQDLGYPYLPQQVVDKSTFDSYTAKIKTVDLRSAGSGELLDMGDCETGACPIR